MITWPGFIGRYLHILQSKFLRDASQRLCLFNKLGWLVGWLFWALRSFETVIQSISGRLPERVRKK